MIHLTTQSRNKFFVYLTISQTPFKHLPIIITTCLPNSPITYSPSFRREKCSNLINSTAVCRIFTHIPFFPLSIEAPLGPYRPIQTQRHIHPMFPPRSPYVPGLYLLGIDSIFLKFTQTHGIIFISSITFSYFLL